MKIHHLRNATMVIESADKFILVDPMLGPVGFMPPFSIFRYKARRNPTVPLPDNSALILDKVTHCLITHRHPDHLDSRAEKFLREKNIPVICNKLDEAILKKKKLNIVQTVEYWKRDNFLGGKIEGISAKHGYGFVAKPMGIVMGFYIALPDEPSIYLSSDTIYTNSVEKVLLEYKPDITVVACGLAQFDLFQKVLMSKEDIIKFVINSPKQVVANHLESINHCPMTRKDLKEFLEKNKIADKVLIPFDGETLNI